MEALGMEADQDLIGRATLRAKGSDIHDLRGMIGAYRTACTLSEGDADDHARVGIESPAYYLQEARRLEHQLRMFSSGTYIKRKVKP
jgi:hypothetical protein